MWRNENGSTLHMRRASRRGSGRRRRRVRRPPGRVRVGDYVHSKRWERRLIEVLMVPLRRHPRRDRAHAGQTGAAVKSWSVLVVLYCCTPWRCAGCTVLGLGRAYCGACTVCTRAGTSHSTSTYIATWTRHRKDKIKLRLFAAMIRHMLLAC